MKSASTAMINLLATDNFLMADLFMFTLVDGSKIYITSTDINITYSGNTYISVAGMSRNSYKLSKGTSVDTLQVMIYPDNTSNNITIGGLPFISACVLGALDGAFLSLNRAFMPTWGDTSAGVVNLFSGRVSTVSGDRTMLQIDVKSMLEYFNIQMPKNLFQAPCSHILYDTGCTINQASYTTNFTVTSVMNNRSIYTGIAQANGYYNSGVISCLTGANAGAKRSITDFTSEIATVSYAWNNIPQIGDTFSISAGCDKTMATCTAKFSNLANYRGFPFVPPPEMSY